MTTLLRRRRSHGTMEAVLVREVGGYEVDRGCRCPSPDRAKPSSG